MIERGHDTRYVELSDPAVRKKKAKTESNTPASVSSERLGQIRPEARLRPMRCADAARLLSTGQRNGPLGKLRALSLISARGHQLQGGTGYGIGCRQPNTASAECTYRLVMLCVLCPSKLAIVGWL
jgi:hypothetical protein